MTDPQQAQPASRALVGLEIADSGTRLSACLPALADARRWHTRLPAPPTPDECVAALVSLVGEVLRDTGLPYLKAVGVALWGRVDARRGIVTRLDRTTAWDGFPLSASLSATLRARVNVASATECAALAETTRLSPALGTRALYVHVGRALTSALVADGAVEGVEGQLGHVRVRDGGPRCSCGLRGHLESIASAQSIVRTMIGLASDSDESHTAMLRVSGGRAEAMTVSQVALLAEQGDPIAMRVIGDALDALAIALADAIALGAPTTLILGGPLTGAGDAFLAHLRDRVEPLTAPFAPPPTLRWGELEPFAALLGAVELAEMA